MQNAKALITYMETGKFVPWSVPGVAFVVDMNADGAKRNYRALAKFDFAG